MRIWILFVFLSFTDTIELKASTASNILAPLKVEMDSSLLLQLFGIAVDENATFGITGEYQKAIEEQLARLLVSTKWLPTDVHQRSVALGAAMTALFPLLQRTPIPKEFRFSFDGTDVLVKTSEAADQTAERLTLLRQALNVKIKEPIKNESISESELHASLAFAKSILYAVSIHPEFYIKNHSLEKADGVEKSKDVLRNICQIFELKFLSGPDEGGDNNFNPLITMHYLTQITRHLVKKGIWEAKTPALSAAAHLIFFIIKAAKQGGRQRSLDYLRTLEMLLNEAYLIRFIAASSLAKHLELKNEYLGYLGSDDNKKDSLPEKSEDKLIYLPQDLLEPLCQLQVLALSDCFSKDFREEIVGLKSSLIAENDVASMKSVLKALDLLIKNLASGQEQVGWEKQWEKNRQCTIEAFPVESSRLRFPSVKKKSPLEELSVDELIAKFNLEEEEEEEKSPPKAKRRSNHSSKPKQLPKRPPQLRVLSQSDIFLAKKLRDIRSEDVRAVFAQGADLSTVKKHLQEIIQRDRPKLQKEADNLKVALGLYNEVEKALNQIALPFVEFANLFSKIKKLASVPRVNIDALSPLAPNDIVTFIDGVDANWRPLVGAVRKRQQLFFDHEKEDLWQKFSSRLDKEIKRCNEIIENPAKFSSLEAENFFKISNLITRDIPEDFHIKWAQFLSSRDQVLSIKKQGNKIAQHAKDLLHKLSSERAKEILGQIQPPVNLTQLLSVAMASNFTTPISGVSVKAGNLYLSRWDKTDKPWHQLLELRAGKPFLFLGLVKVAIGEGYLEAADNLLQGIPLGIDKTGYLQFKGELENVLKQTQEEALKFLGTWGMNAYAIRFNADRFVPGCLVSVFGSRMNLMKLSGADEKPPQSFEGFEDVKRFYSSGMRLVNSDSDLDLGVYSNALVALLLTCYDFQWQEEQNPRGQIGKWPFKVKHHHIISLSELCPDQNSQLWVRHQQLFQPLKRLIAEYSEQWRIKIDLHLALSNHGIWPGPNAENDPDWYLRRLLPGVIEVH